jgi:hypothetical protein
LAYSVLLTNELDAKTSSFTVKKSFTKIEQSHLRDGFWWWSVVNGWDGQDGGLIFRAADSRKVTVEDSLVKEYEGLF